MKAKQEHEYCAVYRVSWKYVKPSYLLKDRDRKMKPIYEIIDKSKDLSHNYKKVYFTEMGVLGGAQKLWKWKPFMLYLILKILIKDEE